MNYKHTQIGYLMIFTLFMVISLFGVILTKTGLDEVIISILSLIILVIASFLYLTVTIDDKYLRIKFGYGIFRKKFVLNEIISAKAVKNHWYFGWGIRFWFWPKMWIFNVSGFDAVEIKMKNGRLYRIGTDEPNKLEQAIKH
ncbi:hypothetical protein CMO83_03450 [Candidatus Woesearchaeota archaeon]|nr:hypothetical protein [Candidatus Woesearchaeota archaeon]